MRLLDLKKGDVLNASEQIRLFGYEGRRTRWHTPADVPLIWHIVVTEFGSDKTVASRLEELGLKPYVPVIYKTVCSGRGRRREVALSMFPCYILLPMPRDGGAWHAVKTTRGVHDFLMRDDRHAATLSEPAIEAIRHVERDIDNKRQQRLALEGKSEWKKGEQVWVEILPFQTVLANIGDVDARGRIEVLLELEMLGRKVWPVEPKQLKHVEL